MKIYILRHEDRTQDATLFSPLTKNGLENAIKLIPRCEELRINHIYSSPYIRTLQTIYPFAKSRGINIKIEYSLSEINDPDIIPKNSHGTSLPEYLAKSFIYNESYKSTMQPEEIKYPETFKEVELRIKNFLKNLITNHHKTDDNIIIVTHQIVCDIILKIGNKKLSDLSYPLGGISLAFEDADWTFKPINFKPKT
jgi:2,3-bisphosphoglycerate-dependent phosphoglycerate mutase